LRLVSVNRQQQQLLFHVEGLHDLCANTAVGVFHQIIRRELLPRARKVLFDIVGFTRVLSRPYMRMAIHNKRVKDAFPLHNGTTNLNPQSHALRIQQLAARRQRVGGVKLVFAGVLPASLCATQPSSVCVSASVLLSESAMYIYTCRHQHLHSVDEHNM